MLQNGNNVILIRPYTLCYLAQMVAHAILSCFQLKTNMMFNCERFHSLFLIENNLHFEHIRISKLLDFKCDSPIFQSTSSCIQYYLYICKTIKSLNRRRMKWAAAATTNRICFLQFCRFPQASLINVVFERFSLWIIIVFIQNHWFLSK